MPGQLRAILGLDALSKKQRAQWSARGFLVLPRFFGKGRIDSLTDLVEDEWRDRQRDDNPLVIDVLEGPLADRRMYFRDAPDDAKQYPYKLNDLYLTRPEVRDVVLDHRLVAILRSLVGGGDVAVCNSLNFERGSQQTYHFDTYYMPGPCTDGLVVTSICLEDVRPDAGPLTYYPGSHQIPPYRFSNGALAAVPDEMDEATEYAYREIAARGLEAVDFHGRKGDVFIWHEQLYHGGRKIADPSLTRRSLVTHYWRADRLEIPEGWHLSPMGEHSGYLSRNHQPVPQDG
jgi:ectoine hydroxylase-related dioxygenase (phytanoyl-CoA dioxygenase family)